MMRCERCGSCSSEQEAKEKGMEEKSAYPRCPVCGSASVQQFDWLTPALCGEHVPIICKSCQSKLDGSCEYVGSPIRTFGSPKNYCVTYKFPKTDPKDNCAIADSGNRREFDTGAVRDMQEGKGRYDLIPWDAIHELAVHCEQGAKKYGERNCEKGIPVHSLIDSAIRHLSCYLRGMKDEPHLRAALWNVAFAIWMEKNRPEMQDIPGRSDAK